MAAFGSKIVVFIGLASLIHAAYSAAQHRSYLRLTEQEFTHLPLDIIVQGLISLLVTVYGVLNVAGDFKEIRSANELESRSFETFGNMPSFYTFNHRGKVLSPDYCKYN